MRLNSKASALAQCCLYQASLFTEHPVSPSGLKVSTANCKETPSIQILHCTCHLLHLGHRHKYSAQLCLAPSPPPWAVIKCQNVDCV